MRPMNTSVAVCVVAIGILFAPGTVPATGQVCVLHERQKLTASDAAADDRFYSVSISDGRVVVGAPYNDYAGEDSGSAYVFRRDDNGTPSDPSDDRWLEEAKLTALDAAAGDHFCFASIDGDRIIVGAYADDDACPEYPDCNSGAAYVFRRDDNDTPAEESDDFWVQEAKLTALDGVAVDWFGEFVAISGNRLVIGARFDDDAGTSSGSAYVFRRDDNGTPSEPGDDLWVQEAKLTASDAAAGDKFGFTASISGDHIVVGAVGDDDACPEYPGCDSGAAYVFRREGTSWIQEAKLTASDASSDDIFGRVSISGNRIIVGAPRADAAGWFSGAAYVFRHTGSTWIQEARLTASDASFNHGFGGNVSISGERAIVGANQDEHAGYYSGAAYVFRCHDNGTPSDPSDDFWFQEVKLTSSDAAVNDTFGNSVSVSGDWAVVGALRDDDACPDDPDCDSGAAYMFALIADCNSNGVPDADDITGGTSTDFNGNEIPDECEVPTLIAEGSRYLGVTPHTIFATPIALQVSSPDYPCLSKYVDTEGLLVDEPVFQECPIVHVHGRDITPSTTYEVRVEFADGSMGEPASVTTSRWGDAVRRFIDGAWLPSDGSVDIVTDVSACLNKFRDLPTAPPLEWCDIEPQIPDGKINIADITYILDAFRGFPYPFAQPCE